MVEMYFENKTIIVWTNEKDDISFVGKLRNRKANVYIASFPDLSETVVFIDDKIYSLSEVECIIREVTE